MSDPHARTIVLTDAPELAPEPRLGPKSPCPQCKAPATRRTDSAGFGARRVVICEGCGFEFPREACA